MEDYSITMRIYTQFGKEHIYHIDYYRLIGKTLRVYSVKEDDIFDAIKCGEPCCISLLVNNELGRSECHLDRCSIKDNCITFVSRTSYTVKSQS